jgi:protein-S-isoprenylcysteine O-methyltransferase Ste14
MGIFARDGGRGIVSQMNSNYRQMIRSSVLGTLALVAVIFIPAGTLNYWQGWAYLGTFIFASALYTSYLVKYDPALLQRRQQAGPSHEKEPAQKIIVLFIFAAFVALIALPPLDYRFGWSPIPWYVSLIGYALVALSFYCFYLVSKVNTYAAANVRVEEGQRVIDTGVYGLVRHPMYFGALFLIVGTPLALGSWWTLLLTPVFLLLLYFRIASEEKVLKRDLAGYAEYQRKVRYRLIPFIW